MVQVVTSWSEVYFEAPAAAAMAVTRKFSRICGEQFNRNISAPVLASDSILILLPMKVYSDALKSGPQVV